MSDFILELYSEEIPAKMQKTASENFLKIAEEILQKNNLIFEKDNLETFISPNRLVLQIKSLLPELIQPAKKKVGPKIDADSKAIEGFLRSNGLKSIDQLSIIDDFYVYNIPENCIKTAKILELALPTILQKMQNSWQKTMIYNVDNSQNQARWVRPLRSILAIFGTEILNINFAHVNSSNYTLDKFTNKIIINNAKEYINTLEKNNIFVNQNIRRQNILSQISILAEKNQLFVADNFANSHFFDELIGLAENPHILMAKIDNKFLELPEEALNLTLQSNQKYICCYDQDGKISAKFFFVFDGVVNPDNLDKIIKDNEKIMRARLTDLEFFIEEDLKIPLINFKNKLAKIIHHQKIGTMQDKLERFREMSKFLSVFVPHCEIGLIDLAVDLSKADLATKAVAEMPELQGQFGSFYANKQHHNFKIVEAIYQHYLPIGASSNTPDSQLAIALSIADKIDNIVGFFLVNEKPSSSKDPFALRRNALGIIRISHQHNIAFPIRILVERSLKTFPPKMLKQYISSDKKEFFIKKKILIEEIVGFIIERLKVYLRDQENIRQDILNVVLTDYIQSLESHKMVDILYLIKKIKFLNNFIADKNHQKIISLYKRSANILSIEEKKDKKIYGGRPSLLAFKSKYEKLLYRRIKKISRDFVKLVTKAEFDKAIALLTVIESPLDNFFEHLIVNDVDPNARENRLILLSLIRSLFNEIGDLSKLELKQSHEIN
jgi:glycyl-tRNA synthetase beta chain